MALCGLGLGMPSFSAPPKALAQYPLTPDLTVQLFASDHIEPVTGRHSMTLNLVQGQQAQPLLSQAVWLSDTDLADLVLADEATTSDVLANWIIYTDMNFDGQPDLALFDGHHSCYSGPAYQVYLAQAGGFTPAPEWTALAQAYCGFFDIDAERQQLHTMSKSGCCWHQYSSFAVVANHLRLVRQETIAHGVFMGLLREDTTLEHDLSTHVSSERQALYLDEAMASEAMFTVTLQDHSRVLLFDLNRDTDAPTVEPQLLWVTGPDHKVLLLWPPSAPSESPFAGPGTSPMRLQFQHEGTGYALGQYQQQHGLWRTQSGHTEFIPSIKPFDLSPWLSAPILPK